MKKNITKIIVFSFVFSLIIGSNISNAEVEKGYAATATSLYSKPNVNSTEVVRIAKKTAFDILDFKDGWYKVQFGRNTGYISNELLINESRPLGSAFITSESAKLYRLPILNNNIVFDLPNQGYLYVYAKVKDWYYVGYEDKRGWIKNNLINVNVDSVTGGVVTGQNVNIRSGPATSYNKIRTATNGEGFILIGTYGTWCNIRLENGSSAWIAKDYFDTGSYSITSNTTALQNVKTTPTTVSTNNVIPASGTTLSTSASSTAPTSILKSQAKIVNVALLQLTTKYVWAGENPGGFDCSGLVKYAHGQADIYLPHNAAMQAAYKGGTWISINSLQPGDCIFFDTNGGLNNIGHTGIYIGKNQFVHASSSKGMVTISELSGYYRNNYMGARRFWK